MYAGEFNYLSSDVSLGRRLDAKLSGLLASKGKLLRLSEAAELAGDRLLNWDLGHVVLLDQPLTEQAAA